jgi:hypothetical protein
MTSQRSTSGNIQALGKENKQLTPQQKHITKWTNKVNTLQAKQKREQCSIDTFLHMRVQQNLQ